MAKKRKKKQTQQAPRPAQSTAKKGEAKPKPKKATPSAGIKRWIAPIALALVVVAALITAQALIRRNAARPTGPWTLTILHTTDVAGYIDPCG
ncbi:MAG: hypothetical protein QHH80_00380 [Anaerolineae bacterium]|nr:hypothetical protein [Anaerolineae bacterium]